MASRVKSYVFYIEWKGGKNSQGRAIHTTNPRILWNFIKAEARNIKDVSVWNSRKTKHFGNYYPSGKKIR